MPPSIYVVRHAETTWNRSPKKFQGRLESPLSEQGLRNAHQLAAELPTFDRVVSSPLQRCVETASILIEGTAASIETDPLLVEIDNGWFGGKTAAEVSLIDDKHFREWMQSPDLCRPGGGESLVEMYTRVTRFFATLKKDLAGTDERCLVVTHGGPIRCLLSAGSKDLHRFHEHVVSNLAFFKFLGADENGAWVEPCNAGDIQPVRGKSS